MYMAQWGCHPEPCKMNKYGKTRLLQKNPFFCLNVGITRLIPFNPKKSRYMDYKVYIHNIRVQYITLHVLSLHYSTLHTIHTYVITYIIHNLYIYIYTYI